MGYGSVASYQCPTATWSVQSPPGGGAMGFYPRSCRFFISPFWLFSSTSLSLLPTFLGTVSPG